MSKADKRSGVTVATGLNRRLALKAALAGTFALANGSIASAASRPTAQKRSEFGIYEGFSGPLHDGWQRNSQYIEARDGTKLAADIFRPLRGGRLHSERLPVVWTPKRYQRASMQADGTLKTALDTEWSPVSKALVQHGFVVVAVDRRGTGASFGTCNELSNRVDADDGYDVTEWLAAQPWSTAKVGMFGASYEGEMQLRVAASAPPHLKAIAPEVSPFDWYNIVHTGGIHRSSFKRFASFVRSLDLDEGNGAVDADTDRQMLRAAIEEHKANDYLAPMGQMPFRDSRHPVTGEQNWLERHGGTYAQGLSRSGVAVYHRVGWFAGVLEDQLAWFVNQTAGPRKMMIGPWGGRGVPPEAAHVWEAEVLRFFDYWLKDVENGIMHEPAIHSSIPSSHVRAGTAWRGIDQWPLPNERRSEFFFHGGSSDTVSSVNDGRLLPNVPTERMAGDDYRVRYDLSYGGTGGNLPTDPAGPNDAAVDHSSFDVQALTYTSDPVGTDVEITGHPAVKLWVSSTAKDGDFFVKLQDVAPNGTSTYIAEGCLRASHRKLARAPYDYFGQPWHSSNEHDCEDIEPGHPARLDIALTPVSYILRSGHRFRISVTGSEEAIAEPLAVDPAPVVTLHRDRLHGSSLTLPIIPA